MSHPAASIKSIFSGKVNLETPDNFEPYIQSTNSSNGILLPTEQSDDLSSSMSQDSSNIINSENLQTLDNKLTHKHGNIGSFQKKSLSSTNVSVGSNDSENQSKYNLARSSPGSIVPDDSSTYLQFDSPSRPLSRNSTTSCLSVTATKDGIEGKRFHRHGPTQYSSNLIANMAQHQHPTATAQFKSTSVDSEVRNCTPIKTIQSPTDSSIPVSNLSQASIKTTNAEFDGQGGLGGKSSYMENFAASGKPLTLKEKISLLGHKSHKGN